MVTAAVIIGVVYWWASSQQFDLLKIMLGSEK